jgi:hypothetical protein
MTDLRQEDYNKFTYLPDIPYNCINYLINNNEVCWRLLKYNDPNAWKLDSDHPNLTKSEKGLLIYDGLKNETDCRIFMDYGQDDSWQDQVSILKITVAEAIPTNYVWGYISIGFEIYSHYQINTLSNYKTRIAMISQNIIETFNGADLGDGIGRLYFEYSKNSRSKMILIGRAPFKGSGILMCNYAL